MKSVDINLKTLGLVNSLSVINEAVIFEKDEDGNVFINSANPGEEIIYQFSAPQNHFDFDGDECAFYNYPEFYNLLTTYEKPTMVQDGMDVVIKEKKSEIRYRLTDPEGVEQVFTEVEFEDPDAVFTLTKDQIKELTRIINKITGEVINLAVDGDVITIKISNPKHKNSWKNEYELTESTDEKYDMNISADIFTVLPDGDYDVSILSDGLIRFVLKTEDELKDVKVEIYTGEEEDED